MSTSRLPGIVSNSVPKSGHIHLKSPSLLPTASYINNEVRFSPDSQDLQVLNPSSGAVIATLKQATTREIHAAIDAATTAQIKWRDTDIDQRITLLNTWVQHLRAARDDIAHVITCENGKPYSQALDEVEYAAGYFDWNAQHILHTINTSTSNQSGVLRTILSKSAIGVALAITPWNFPLAMLARKVAPAVAAGCAVIAKPSEVTPLSALLLAELGRLSGAPNGLFNVLVSDESKQVVDTVLDANCVQMVSFTGSTKVGKLIAERAARRVLRVSLELGGNAPFVVFEDADIESAIEGLLKNKLRNSGQSCVSANRVFVQNTIYDAFIDKLSERLSAVKVGDGFEDMDLGPLIGSASIDKIRGQIANAQQHGAKCIAGGETSGNFCDATLLTEVNDDMLVAREEIFGPVIGVLRFEDEQEVWTRANMTQAGLAAYVYTQDIGKSMRAIRELEYGMIGINDVTLSTPSTAFGGLRESGVGKEGGEESLHDYISSKFARVRF